MQLSDILRSLGISYSPISAQWFDNGAPITREDVVFRLIATGYPLLLTGYQQLRADLDAFERSSDAKR